ncbi:MAG: helix-turn-helix domain-containing protein [Phycisphaerae bacterium]|nr:helix-turn-helix domain-containing protein [Phycisphaerae bacterium]
MSSPEQALAQRLKELRRRHFGPKGKALFARRLGLSLDEYTRYERGVVPPGEVMVRICEATGEDLQWLLTGVASRGTVVIAGARGRHRDVLARLANLLDKKPELAAAVESFLDLLMQGEQEARETAAPVLPEPKLESLIRIFELNELPLTLPETTPDGPGKYELAPFENGTPPLSREQVELLEPALEYPPDAGQRVELVSVRTADGRTCRCIHNAEIARCFPSAFGVRLADNTMQPMFQAGDAAVVTAEAEAKIGRPAICRVTDEPAARCRIWLGRENGIVHLGRLADGEVERVAHEKVQWSLEALFRLALAA